MIARGQNNQLGVCHLGHSRIYQAQEPGTGTRHRNQTQEPDTGCLLRRGCWLDWFLILSSALFDVVKRALEIGQGKFFSL